MNHLGKRMCRSLSIKSKLSIVITLMLVSVLLLYHLLSEYSMVQGVRNILLESMKSISVQLMDSIAEYEKPGADDQPAGSEHPEKMIAILQKFHPAIVAVSVYDRETGQLRYGSESRHLNAINVGRIPQADSSHPFRLMEAKDDDKRLYMTLYEPNDGSSYDIAIVYDQSIIKSIVSVKRDYTLLYSVFFMIAAIVLVYWLVGVMMRPLKDILWKVNEVSSVRFQKPIQIRGKDEFGLLALKINAMSQNLSIYMNKLRRAFEENRNMKEYLESFINNSNDAIHLMDVDGKVIQVNRAFEQLFGYEQSVVLGTVHPTIPESKIKEIRHMLEQLKKGKKLPAHETVRETLGGEMIPVSVTLSPIRETDGRITGFASICRDMRTRNRMEELLRRSEKLTTVGQLAAGVAHEIRNPLTTLRGFLQLQQQSGSLNQSHVKLMLSELDRINLIVGEFLILAKPQATKFVAKDVRNVLQDVLVFLDSEAHLHNIVFRQVFTEEDCSISCEENQLKQVFINLLKNAIEAMPGGGVVHISVQRKGGSVAISITDEGIGIPEDMISKIGDPFFTAKETGTGLGIMVSQRIINSHQGTMDIQSQVNIGTSVKVTLPALRDAVAG